MKKRIEKEQRFLFRMMIKIISLSKHKQAVHLRTCNVICKCGIIVVLRFGKLSVMSPVALTLVEKEVIKFQSAKIIDKNKYKLIDLIRWQEDTKEHKHTVSEKLILPNNSIIPLEVHSGKVLPKSNHL
ncbi:MAG: hypothetical protein ACR5K2_01130 [Wolbachia sp.]